MAISPLWYLTPVVVPGTVHLPQHLDTFALLGNAAAATVIQSIARGRRGRKLSQVMRGEADNKGKLLAEGDDARHIAIQEKLRLYREKVPPPHFPQLLQPWILDGVFQVTCVLLVEPCGGKDAPY